MKYSRQVWRPLFIIRMAFSLVCMLVISTQHLQAQQNQARQLSSEPSEDDTNLMTLTVTTIDEPFSAVMLNHLEAALPKVHNESERVQIAAILYRYKRSSGYSYLLHELKDHSNLIAASVLALNHDKSSLDLILKVMAQNNEVPPVLANALAAWDTPQIGNALLRAYRSDQDNPHLAMALSSWGVRDVIPEMQRIYKNVSTDEEDKIYFGAALVHLDADNSEPILKALLERLQQKPANSPFPSPYARFFIFQAFKILDEKKSLPSLLDTLRHYKGISKKLQIDSREILPPDEVAVQAAEIIAKVGEKSDSSLIAHLLLQLKADESLLAPRYNMYGESPQSRVATALIKLEGKAGEAVAQKVMGKEWLEHELIKLSLRPIPKDLLIFNEDLSTILGN